MSLHGSKLSKAEQHTLKRLKNDEDIVILPADKRRVTVVMDKTVYHYKMDALVNDKQTYKELKRDPTPALQHKLNSTLLTLKKANAIDTQRYYRLRCSVPQPPKIYGLPKLHKPQWFPNATYGFFLWLSDIPTVQVPYDDTTTAHRQIQT